MPAQPSKAKRHESKTYKKGLQAERWASWILRAKGYQILHKRYKTRGGEIDLIAKRGSTVAFVEVKYRQSIEEALYSITPRNQARIIAATQYFLANEDQMGAQTYRFDVMAFAPSAKYQHLEAAFDAF